MVKKKKVRRKVRPGRAPAVLRDPNRPLLSLAMMVKNEEVFLEDALRSARDWVDEMVVVDTGSEDRTVEIARDLGARVEFFPWNDSFSEARNATLRHSRGEWVAILDADERFRSPQPAAIRQHLERGPSWPFQALMVNVVNTRLDGTPMTSFFSVRFFPNVPDKLGYGGRVHNRFGPLVEGVTVDATRYLGLEVVHLGYDPELYAQRKKAERSLPLIERHVAENPGDMQYRFYLGREYELLGRHEEARDALGVALEGILAAGAGPLQETATTLVKACEALGDDETALRAVEAALPRQPRHPDLLFARARIHTRRGDRQAAIADLVPALEGVNRRVIEGQVELAHNRWQARELLAGHLFAAGSYQDAYALYLAALPDKPRDDPGWGVFLNSLCALAIEFGDDARLPDLLDRLLARDDTPLGMFLFEVRRRAERGDPEGARALLTDGLRRCPRLAEDPDFPTIQRLLGAP